MHSNPVRIEELYSSLRTHDFRAIAECYHSGATFEDIAFSLRGEQQITDLKAPFNKFTADEILVVTELVDTYTFMDTRRKNANRSGSELKCRDNITIIKKYSCSSLFWGNRTLGLFKG